MSKSGLSRPAPKSGVKSRPQPIQAILTNTLRQFGLDQRLARYQFVQHWPEIVGADIAVRTAPECIRNGALVVRVCDSTWAQELSFRKEVILNRLKRFISQDEVVKDVMFYVAQPERKS